MKKLARRDLIINAALGAVAMKTKAEEPPKPVLPTDAEIVATDKTLAHNYTEAERKLMAKPLDDIRGQFKDIRSVALTQLDEPATHFQPLRPDVKSQKGSIVGISKGKAIDYHGDAESLAFFSVVELSRLIRAKKISSLELTRMYIARLKKYGPILHCVINLTEELALKQAARADKEIAEGKYRGALHGIPWGAKDLLATNGIPTTWGAKPFEHQIFDYDATVVERLEAAGAVLVAKLSMGELAMDNVWFGGPTLCPWDTKQGSSGSSAGPGSATAAGLVGFSIGSETLGSIVSPSVRNGVTGLRPTYGRVSRHGAMPLCWTMDKLGPMCRGVEDAALIFHAIHGTDGHDVTCVDRPFRWNPNSNLADLRVGVNSASFEALKKGKDTDRVKTYDDALAEIKKLGITLKPIDLPKMNPGYDAIADIIIGVEGAASFAELNMSGRLSELAQQAPDSWPTIFRVGSTIPGSDYVNALRLRARLQQEMNAVMKDIDVLISVPLEGPAIYITNLTGHPTVVTRCGTNKNMPESIEFIGGLDQEAAILRLAHAYEKATLHHKQWPDMSKVVV